MTFPLGHWIIFGQCVGIRGCGWSNPGFQPVPGWRNWSLGRKRSIIWRRRWAWSWSCVPLFTFSDANLHETEVLLEAAAGRGVPVLLTSTSEVYGKSQKQAFDEEDDLLIGPPHQARWSYACSKLMDEFLALAYAKERALPVVIARLFNTVGPRQTGRYGMVLPRFIGAARSGQPLKVYGDGQQTRCFCYVRDTVEALVRLQRCAAARGQVFNVGGTEEISIVDLARRVIEDPGIEICH